MLSKVDAENGDICFYLNTGQRPDTPLQGTRGPHLEKQTHNIVNVYRESDEDLGKTLKKHFKITEAAFPQLLATDAYSEHVDLLSWYLMLACLL